MCDADGPRRPEVHAVLLGQHYRPAIKTVVVKMFVWN